MKLGDCFEAFLRTKTAFVGNRSAECAAKIAIEGEGNRSNEASLGNRRKEI